MILHIPTYGVCTSFSRTSSAVFTEGTQAPLQRPPLHCCQWNQNPFGPLHYFGGATPGGGQIITRKERVSTNVIHVFLGAGEINFTNDQTTRRVRDHTTL